MRLLLLLAVCFALWGCTRITVITQIQSEGDPAAKGDSIHVAEGPGVQVKTGPPSPKSDP